MHAAKKRVPTPKQKHPQGVIRKKLVATAHRFERACKRKGKRSGTFCGEESQRNKAPRRRGGASRLRARSRFGSADPPDPHSPPNRPSSNRTLRARFNGGSTISKTKAPARGAFGGASRLTARSRFGSEAPPGLHSPPNRPSSNRTLRARFNGGAPSPKQKHPQGVLLFWRRHPESNRG